MRALDLNILLIKVLGVQPVFKVSMKDADTIGKKLDYLKEKSFGYKEIGNILVYLVQDERPRNLHESFDNYRGSLGNDVKGGLNEIIKKFERHNDKNKILDEAKQLNSFDINPKTRANYENIRTLVYNIKSKSNSFPEGFFENVADCFFKGSEEARKAGTNLMKEYDKALGRLHSMYRDILGQD